MPQFLSCPFCHGMAQHRCPHQMLELWYWTSHPPVWKIHCFLYVIQSVLACYSDIKQNKTIMSQQEYEATKPTWKISSSGFCILWSMGDITGKSSHKMLGHLQSYENNDGIHAKRWDLKCPPSFSVSCLALILELHMGWPAGVASMSQRAFSISSLQDRRFSHGAR